MGLLEPHARYDPGPRSDLEARQMAGAFVRMTDLDLEGKRVLIREDLNATVKDGRVTSATRLLAALPTLRSALEQRARVLVLSHLGRPKEGVFDAAFSLAPVAARLAELLERDVPLVADWLDGVGIAPGAHALGGEVGV